MELRKQKEQRFQNIAINQRTRERARKFYEITRKSRNYYWEFLQLHCKNRKVLDYGCGIGNNSFWLAEKGAIVTGIDISNVAIDNATARSQREQIKNIEFHIMDAENMNFKDDFFDLICGVSILHHLDLTKAYSEIARVLKPNGQAIFLEPLGHNAVINLYRKTTPNLRSEDEHPLLKKDLELAREFFQMQQAKFFHLFSLLCVPFRKLPGFPTFLGFLDWIDSALFSIFPLARKYAWTVVIVFSKPNKSVPHQN